jgi:pimeloyl-ACP methyl ester carboxylesterase/DNA-binding CsgD family transcriptional regulator
MSRQVIRYLITSDGVRLAWAKSGSGPPLVKAANWLSHLEYDWESPCWRHWMRFFSDHFRFVRYDERGCGMTDWDAGNLSLDRWTEDLEEVIEAAKPDRPATLLGISQGGATCIAYAVRHPERVSRLILGGAYARGVWRRGQPEAERAYRAIIDLVRFGWGQENPAFRQVFTSRFIPGGTDEQIRWFNELARKTTSPSIAAPILETRGHIDVTDLLGQIGVPTLVIHARDDAVVPFDEGQFLASRIPNAEFVELDSRNHVLLEHEPAWKRFCDAILDFTQCGHAGDGAFASLSQREREVLSLLADGLSNADIASRLGISDKTVRNHLSKLFDKLGVWTRAQAIVFARDHGFTRENL